MSILEKLTNQMQGTIESGVSLALHNKNQEVDPIHLMWALLTNSGSILHQALNKMNVDKAAIELETKSVANKLPTVSSVTKKNIKLGQNLVRTLQNAEGVMAANGDQYLAVDAWLMANTSESFMVETLGKYVDMLNWRNEDLNPEDGEVYDNHLIRIEWIEQVIEEIDHALEYGECE